MLREPRPFRSLWPYAYALAWLLFFELLLRWASPLAPDPRVLRAPLPAYGCVADDELARLVSARAQSSPALDVVLIGDSVLGSVNNAPGERLADVLGEALKQAQAQHGPSRPPVRVFNLSAGGMRAADVYGSLRRLQTALADSPRRFSDLVLVLSSNVIFFSRRHSQPPMLYPCLLDEAHSLDDDALRRRLALPPPPKPLQRRIAGWLAANVYLYQQRRHLAEAIFGGPPRSALRERLQGLAHREQRPTGTPLSYAQYAPNYEFIPLQAPEALNYQATEQLAQALKRFAAAEPGLRMLVVMTPHNHAKLGPLTDTAAYRDLGAALSGLFGRAGVPFFSYDHNPAIATEMFLDLDHLTAAGNQALAGLVARDVAGLLQPE